MNEILGIEVPSDLNTLSSEDLTGLVEQLRTAAVEAAGGEVDLDKLAEIKAARDTLTQGKTVLAERKTAEDELACECQSIRDELSDDSKDAEEEEPAAEEAEEVEVETQTETTTKVPASAVTVSTGAGTTSTVTAGAGGGGMTVNTWQPRTRTASAISSQTPEPEPKVALSPVNVPIKAVSGVSGYNAGDQFETLTDLTRALLTRFDDIAGGGTEKLTVGRIDGRFADDVRLTENMASNIEKLGGLDLNTPQSMASITAAMCAPAEPYYGLACMSSTERPVRGSLGTYVPMRGAITVYPSPKLADITGGTGLWTRADDANSSATKTACAVIPCATSVQYDIYGIYRCMTITNLLQMTYPELVEAFLNRLAAIQARLAEVTLLDAMLASVNLFNVTVAAPSPNLGASINLWASLIRALAVYREQERYGDQTLDMWAPRWMREALRIDIVRQRSTVGATAASRVPTGGEVDAALSAVGVNVTWTMDNATTWTGVGQQADAAALVALPTTAKVIVAPRGNFRLLDRGDLQIGVTNNHIYRDNTSNTKNNFTMFYESFEGLMDFGCRSWEISFAGFSPNGQQIGDIAAS